MRPITDYMDDTSGQVSFGQCNGIIYNFLLSEKDQCVKEEIVSWCDKYQQYLDQSCAECETLLDFMAIFEDVNRKWARLQSITQQFDRFETMHGRMYASEQLFKSAAYRALSKYEEQLLSLIVLEKDQISVLGQLCEVFLDLERFVSEQRSFQSKIAQIMRPYILDSLERNDEGVLLPTLIQNTLEALLQLSRACKFKQEVFIELRQIVVDFARARVPKFSEAMVLSYGWFSRCAVARLEEFRLLPAQKLHEIRSREAYLFKLPRFCVQFLAFARISFEDEVLPQIKNGIVKRLEGIQTAQISETLWRHSLFCDQLLAHRPQVYGFVKTQIRVTQSQQLALEALESREKAALLFDHIDQAFFLQQFTFRLANPVVANQEQVLGEIAVEIRDKVVYDVGYMLCMLMDSFSRLGYFEVSNDVENAAQLDLEPLRFGERIMLGEATVRIEGHSVKMLPLYAAYWEAMEFPFPEIQTQIERSYAAWAQAKTTELAILPLDSCAPRVHQTETPKLDSDDFALCRVMRVLKQKRELTTQNLAQELGLQIGDMRRLLDQGLNKDVLELDGDVVRWPE